MIVMAPTSEEARLMKALLDEIKRLTLTVKRIERLLEINMAPDALDVTTYGDSEVVMLEE